MLPTRSCVAYRFLAGILLRSSEGGKMLGREGSGVKISIMFYCTGI